LPSPLRGEGTSGNHKGQYWTSQDDAGWPKLRPQFWKLCLDMVV